MNKALDYGKLLEQQKQGKLLKKKLIFPASVEIKYDGNYCTIVVKDGKVEYFSSKPKRYLHNSDTTFNNARDGVYLAERISGSGKLGRRTEVSLFGPKDLQSARADNTYMIHDYLTLDEYSKGYTDLTFIERRYRLLECGIDGRDIVTSCSVTSLEEVEDYLNKMCKLGYEGIIIKSHSWKWKRTSSRKPEFAKWKKRPTVDLLCIDTKGGTGKYSNMIGSLLLKDSYGREVWVGSGLSDEDRYKDRDWFIGKVFEVEFEQILGTYIQPTLVCHREDKTKEDID